MRKVLYISGTRADYGLMKTALFKIDRRMSLEIVVTGMHLMREFGQTFIDIQQDSFKVHKVKVFYRNDHRNAASFFIGGLVNKLTKKLKK